MPSDSASPDSAPSILDWLTQNADRIPGTMHLHHDAVTFVRPGPETGLKTICDGETSSEYLHKQMGVRLLTLNNFECIPFHKHDDPRREKYYNHRGPGVIFVLLYDSVTGNTVPHMLSENGQRRLLIPAKTWHAVLCYDFLEQKSASVEILIFYDDPKDTKWEPNTKGLLKNRRPQLRSDET